MRILLTGHQGYIGAVALPMLRDLGHDVTGLDSGLFEECSLGPYVATPGPALAIDLRDVRVDQLHGYDAVFHLAGLSNDPLGDVDPGLTYAINLEGTLRLAAMAKEAGVPRFLFSSSCSSYGAAGDDLLDETAALAPVTPYAVSKVQAEQGLSKLADASFTPTYLRNATAYGASPRLRLDLVLNDLVAAALTSGRILLKSDGTPWRPIVHVRDIVAAFVAIAEAPRDAVHDQAFNVGQSAENYRIREIAEIVQGLVPGSVIEIAPGAGPDKRCYRVNCEKIRRHVPAFQPVWDARRGAEELLATYRQVGLDRAAIDGPRFKRLAHLRTLLAAGRIDDQLRFTGK